MAISKISFNAREFDTTPAFFAKINSEQVNPTITSHHTIVWETEIYDNGADYNTSTGVFTAPVTGVYNFSCWLKLSDADQDATYIYTYFQAGGKNVTFTVIDPDVYDQDNPHQNFGGSATIDLDAGDTAVVKIIQLAGANQGDFSEGYFCGHLVG